MIESHRRLSVLLLLAALFLTTETLCAAKSFLANGYAVRIWQTDDGLPQNLVTSGAQTRDGYLWFGTFNGLARFDGERFRVFEPANTPALQDRRISCLYEDKAGTLWIGHESGDITRFREHFEAFPNATQSRSKVIGLGADKTEQLWAMREHGGLECLDSGLRLPSFMQPDALPGVLSWSCGADGELWMAQNGRLARLDSGKLEVLELPVLYRTNYVLSVAASKEGGAWVFCDDRIRRWKDGAWVEDLGAYPWPDTSLDCALELRDGTLAIGTIYSGLWLVFRDGRAPVHFNRGNGLPQDWVRFLFEDREGTLWAGAGGAGLVSFHKTPLSTLEPPDQWRGCTVLSVAPGAGGSLWVGTEGASLYRYSGGEWKNFVFEHGLKNWYVSAVTETVRGETWVGNYWWGGPSRWTGNQFRAPTSIDEKFSPVLSLAASRDGQSLLVGNCDGLFRLQDDQVEWLARLPTPSAGGVCAIVETAEGTLWAGFKHAGLLRVEKTVSKYFGPAEGLASTSVECLALDGTGALWIGTADRGLNRYKNGRFTSLTSAQGLLDNCVGHILDDGRGHFWLSTNHGLQRLAVAELNRCADGLIPRVSGKIFDSNDGLPTSEFVGGLQSAACRTQDGRLWFASSKGLICIDPERIENNPAPPPVLLQAVRVDGNELALSGEQIDRSLPPDHSRLQFHYAGLSFVAPDKVRFKYRLDGIDSNWVDAGTQRSAFYSRLPAGDYRFHVIACNNDGLWNMEGSSIAFSVAPFFWQTWWFLGACSLAGCAGVTALARHYTRKRMQRKVELAERRHAVERERTRIAQDIHDDIGATLSRIAMLSQPAAQAEGAEAGHTHAQLSRIYGTARDLTRSLDEIVWAVDPKHDTLESLVDYMGKYAQEFLSAAQVRCRLNLPVLVPPWPLGAELRHHLFLSFKEALNNAVKHSGADEIRITLELQDESFEFRVQDNGRGFATPHSVAASPAPAGRLRGGNGLGNMQERIRRSGGRCTLHSVPQGGTTVSFLIPMSRATQAAPQRSAPTRS